MTNFVGEQFRVVLTAKDYNNGTLNDTNVDHVEILILNRDRTELLDETMTWNAGDALWEYLWDTDGLEPGTYRYRITVVGVDGKPSFEWDRARLAKPVTIEV